MSASSGRGQLVRITEGEECPKCGKPGEREGVDDFSRNLGGRFEIWVHARYRGRKVDYCAVDRD